MPDLTTILADALFAFHSWEPGTARSEARAIVAAIPDAERDSLELGLAWLRVERALPEGWAIHLDSNLDLASFSASADPLDGGRPRPFETGYGPTPAAALTALAEALEAGRP